MKAMHILFVCTGNISRSPMAEILAPHIFNEPSLEFSSAGTRGLHDYAISREAERLLQRNHISQMTVDAFRSRRLTAAIAAKADLILCFEQHQRTQIVVESPLKARRTFMLNDFANLCEEAQERGVIKGDTVEDRILYVANAAPLLRMSVSIPADIEDPQGKDMEAYIIAHNETVRALKRIAAAVA